MQPTGSTLGQRSTYESLFKKGQPADRELDVVRATLCHHRFDVGIRAPGTRR